MRAYETNASEGEDRHTDTKKKRRNLKYQDANISENNESLSLSLSLHFCDIDFTTMRYTQSLSLSNDECLAGILLRTSASFL